MAVCLSSLQAACALTHSSGMLISTVHPYGHMPTDARQQRI